MYFQDDDGAQARIVVDVSSMAEKTYDVSRKFSRYQIFMIDPRKINENRVVQRADKIISRGVVGRVTSEGEKR